MIDDNHPTPDSIGGDAMRASLFSKLFDKEPKTVSVGRYRILDEIGVGGMGQVFSAYDEELDRKVAIKVVHGANASEQARGRLRREAQALGRLAHPNVVTVHEIGEHNGQIFVAMEFVRGLTLRQWRGAEERDTPAILAVYLQAARGLQAAHEAGILHRDFKPDNALVGDDGRVRVLDFGLARAFAEQDAEPTEPAPHMDGDVALTATGAVLGTPTYMAPEQFLSKATGARTDQFAFCVALWEALIGERPFAGSSYAELAANVTSGSRQPMPKDATVPARIRTMLETGLATEPAHRHPDMAQVVRTLDTVLTPRRARWWIPATAVPLLAVAAYAAVREAPAARSLEDCLPAAERLAGVWDDDARAALASTFAASPAPYVAATWESLRRQQDEIAAAWGRSYERACVATSSADAAIRRLAAQRLDCLDGSLPMLGRFAKLDTVQAAQQFASGYDGSAHTSGLACENDEFVRRLPPPPDPEVAAKELEVREQLLAAQLMMMTGRPLDALPEAERAIEAARAIGYAPLLAETLRLRARLKASQGLPGGAEAVAEALHAAEAAGLDSMTFALLLTTAFMAENDEARIETLDRAESVLTRLGSPVDERVQLSLSRADALERAKHFDEAYIRTNELAETYGRDERVGVALRGMLFLHLANRDRARRDSAVQLSAAQAAIEVLSAEVGPQHPATATARDFAAWALYQLGRYEESVAQYEELEASLRAVFPDGHPRLGWVLTMLGGAHEAQGNIAEAERLGRQSEAMLSDLLGPTHNEVLRGPALNLAGYALMRGDEQELRRRAQVYRDAESDAPQAWIVSSVVAALDGDAERARVDLARVIAVAGDEVVATIRLSACYIHWILGEHAQAVDYARKAIDDPEMPDYLGQGSTAMAGFVLASTGDHARALPLLETALKRAAKVAPPTIPWFSPMAHYALALSLEETGGDHDRAVRAARTAVQQAPLTGLPRLEIEASATAWLAKHAPEQP